MVKKKIERPELPRIRRRKWKEAGWLVMEPAKLGLVVGCLSAGVAALVLFVRQQLGTAMAVGDVILGVAKTFVISYFAAGVFVVYLLWVAERELAPPDERKQRAGLKGGRPAKASEEAPAVDAPPEPTSELDVIAEALDRLGAMKSADDESQPPK